MKLSLITALLALALEAYGGVIYTKDSCAPSGAYANVIPQSNCNSVTGRVYIWSIRHEDGTCQTISGRAATPTSACIHYKFRAGYSAIYTRDNCHPAGAFANVYSNTDCDKFKEFSGYIWSIGRNGQCKNIHSTAATPFQACLEAK